MELRLDYRRIRLEYDLPSAYRSYMEARFKTCHFHLGEKNKTRTNVKKVGVLRYEKLGLQF